MGSFVPWLYYGFYCHYEHKLVYLSVVLVLGVLSIIVSLYDKFSEPNFRPLRAGMAVLNEFPHFHSLFTFRYKNAYHFSVPGVFASFGLSGIIPAIHYGLMEGWFNKISQASLGWLILMGKKKNKIGPKHLRTLHTHYTDSRFAVHSWCGFLCAACTGTMVSWKIRFMGTRWFTIALQFNWIDIYLFFFFFFCFSYRSFNHIKYSMCWSLRPLLFTTMVSARWQCIV